MAAQGAAAFWDALHAQARFRPVYPNEHAVRFLAGRASQGAAGGRGLDIGVGSGRHTVLLSNFGYDVDGVDVSPEGLRHASRFLAERGVHARLTEASMDSLPFDDNTFDVALSVGVFYYGTAEQGRAAVDELYRVMRKGGEALVIVRTTRDARRGRGEALGNETYRLTIEHTNELGTVQHFLSEDDVYRVFGQFAGLDLELTETTFANRSERNSDWLITVRK